MRLKIVLIGQLFVLMGLGKEGGVSVLLEGDWEERKEVIE
jgi:hypothetical protein